MTDAPFMTQFRLEFSDDGIVHLIFDCPGRTMNLFSNAAIEDIGAFSAWLPGAPVRGVLIRSGKENAFCAGADLTELQTAYDEIVASPPHRRFNHAFEHFFRLSAALRGLEAAGKPVVAAIAGLALGGGCELAMAAHYRVLVDAPGVALGLPESLVGLLPGGGGTQRLPRLIGVEAALPILLGGVRLEGQAALAAKLVDALAVPGEEIARAEAWLRQQTTRSQPWDCDGWQSMQAADVSAAIAPVRAEVTAHTLGNYPAPLAILDCIEFGLPQVFDGAIRTEMAIFAHLIQREEPRNMIRTMFVAKTEYERLKRKDALPASLSAGLAVAKAAMASLPDNPNLASAGFGNIALGATRRPTKGLWLDEPEAQPSRKEVDRIAAEIEAVARDWSGDERRLLDYAVVSTLGFPAYLGGPLAWAMRQA